MSHCILTLHTERAKNIESVIKNTELQFLNSAASCTLLCAAGKIGSFSPLIMHVWWIFFLGWCCFFKPSCCKSACLYRTHCYPRAHAGVAFIYTYMAETHNMHGADDHQRILRCFPVGRGLIFISSIVSLLSSDWRGLHPPLCWKYALGGVVNMLFAAVWAQERNI